MHFPHPFIASLGGRLLKVFLFFFFFTVSRSGIETCAGTEYVTDRHISLERENPRCVNSAAQNPRIMMWVFKDEGERAALMAIVRDYIAGQSR